jgi:hemerythrin-like metal-binding protein
MQANCGDSVLLSLTQLDREHWELIAEENEFTAAAEAGASRAELEIRLTHLIQGFQNHFSSEERLMRLHSFPGLEVHTGEHRKLIGQLRELRDALASGVVKLCDALVGFVQLWTEQHMNGPDRSFARFLNQKATCAPSLFSIPQEPEPNTAST